METHSITTKIMFKNWHYDFSKNDVPSIFSSENPSDEIYGGFPQIINLKNIETSIEFNRFLLDKYIYNDFNINRKNNEISKLRIENLLNSLKIFLNWLTQNLINWKDELTTSEESPIKLYQKYLIDLIEEEKIEYSTATTYYRDVTMLYEWAVSRRIIDTLPFEYNINYNNNYRIDRITAKTQPIRKNFSSTLKIPKKYKSKKTKFLSSYTPEEYYELINTKYCKTPTRQIWIKLAKEYGLRRNEIININEDIIDDAKNGLYQVIGKGNKLREIYFKKEIINEIINYCNSHQRKIALKKHYLINDYTSSPPLFLNNKGIRIKPKSLSNIIYPAKEELSSKGFHFNKTFHDLRATYAVERFLELLKNGFDLDAIELIISDELGHSLFETTKRYLRIIKAREAWAIQSGIANVIKIEHMNENDDAEDILNDFL